MATEALVSKFAETLATMAKEELLGAEDAVRQLEKDVREFSRVLQDAEHRAFTSYAIRGWLADVKDLVYDADDIIDYSRTHAEKLARLSSEHPVLCYPPMLSFFRRVALRHRTGNMITSVIGRVEMIRKVLSPLIAVAAPLDDDDSGSSSWSRIQRQTGPLLEADIVVGSEIENGTSYLVGLLTREERELGGRRIRVVAITGMGGVGKTTLAQKIYNHPTIEDSFREPPPMWVCVSQLYSDEQLLREIIMCAGGGVTGRHDSFVELQRRLATVIKGKKFFLVLDDVWDTRVWVHLLQNPLENGAVGSRVLITTRQPSVAKQMGAIYMHSVDPLSVEESWALLRKLVFQEDEKIGHGELEEIGMQITIGCRGLPLAIKTVAGVLRTKSPTRSEWKKVLINPAWSLEEFPDGAMGVLYLSYKDLPLELKQCFIFCSLFPEDHLFERDTLTRLWVAEGFIAERGENVLLEDVADGYYNELLSKNLLQREPAANERKCKMNVHLRSLGWFLARDEYGDVSQFVNATKTSSSSSSSSSLMKLRHLLIVDTMHHNVVTQVIKENKSLRTLFLPKSTGDTTDFLFNKLGRLRVLSCSLVKSLPKSVGNLIHLRYLNLSWSSFVELPETVGNLSNLQYLNLNNCWSLKKLPRGIAKLYKLRFLDLEGTSVDGLPAGIGRLQHLNCLKGFVTNEQEDNEDGGWCSLEELISLSQLRTLTILNLERALIEFKGQPRDRGFQLERLRHLRYLELRCSTGDQQYWDDDKKQKMFQLNFEVNCFPPPSLETFKIYRYFGLKFPDWLITYFPSLTTLELWDCKYCKQLPALGLLPKLNELSISRASSVESIGPEFMGMGMRVDALAFPMLTTLKLEFMSNLVAWQWDSVVAMPRLEELSILKCPKLRSLPDGLGSVTTLTTLSIQDDDSLSVIENLHSLKVLLVWGNNNLTRVYNLPALQTMEVYKCNAPREVEGLNSLQSLYIYATEMESLPEWLLLKGGQPAFPMLKSLRIEVYKNVQVLHSCLVDGLDWPKIQHYPQVHITKYNMGYELFVRYTKYPFTFTTNLKVDGSAGDGGATAYPEN